MKRLYCAFISLFIVFTFFYVFSFKSYAVTAPNNREYESYFRVGRSSGSVVWDIWINSSRIGLSKEHVVGTDYNVFGLENGNLKQLYYYYHSLTNNSSDYSYGYAELVSGNINGNIATYPSENCPLFDTDEELLNYLMNGSIDFDTLYYDPLIPLPILDVRYASYNASGITIPFMPISVNITNPDSNYCIEFVTRNYVPTAIGVNVGSYERYSYELMEKDFIYSLEDMNNSQNFSKDDVYSAMDLSWTNDLGSVDFSDIEFTDNIGNTIAFNRAKSRYEQLRNIACFYGNITEIWARYFLIDSDNRVVVGKWVHWWSLNQEAFDEEIPDFYVPYEKAYGTQNNDPNENLPSGGSVNQVGTTYAPSQTVTVVNNVPNYPDYPTIATYNKDNLLVDTMNFLDGDNGLNSFFGGFGDFLIASFAFIPDWIWAIIGLGFSLSIIVMFLKIL